MISADMYVKVNFDEDGKRKIESAVLTIRDVVNALRKVGGQTATIEDELEQAESYLSAILDGVTW